MKLTSIGTVRVRGRDIGVFIDSSNNAFRADLDGNSFTAPSFALLKKKVSDTLGKTRLKIPVTIIQNTWRSEVTELTPGTLVGLHSNGNLLVEARGATQQVHSYEAVYVGFDEVVTKHYRDLVAAKVKATEALDKFLEGRRVHLVDVRSALEDKGPLLAYGTSEKRVVKKKKAKVK